MDPNLLRAIRSHTKIPKNNEKNNIHKNKNSANKKCHNSVTATCKLTASTAMPIIKTFKTNNNNLNLNDVILNGRNRLRKTPKLIVKNKNNIHKNKNSVKTNIEVNSMINSSNGEDTINKNVYDTTAVPPMPTKSNSNNTINHKIAQHKTHKLGNYFIAPSRLQILKKRELGQLHTIYFHTMELGAETNFVVNELLYNIYDLFTTNPFKRPSVQHALRWSKEALIKSSIFIMKISWKFIKYCSYHVYACLSSKIDIILSTVFFPVRYVYTGVCTRVCTGLCENDEGNIIVNNNIVNNNNNEVNNEVPFNYNQGLEGVSTITKIQFLEQELARLKADMEIVKDIEAKDAINQQPPAAINSIHNAIKNGSTLKKLRRVNSKELLKNRKMKKKNVKGGMKDMFEFALKQKFGNARGSRGSSLDDYDDDGNNNNCGDGGDTMRWSTDSPTPGKQSIEQSIENMNNEQKSSKLKTKIFHINTTNNNNINNINNITATTIDKIKQKKRSSSFQLNNNGTKSKNKNKPPPPPRQRLKSSPALNRVTNSDSAWNKKLNNNRNKTNNNSNKTN